MKDKIITLKNGEEYVVVEECLYNDEQYYLASEVIKDEPSENFIVFKIKYIGDKKQLIKINDEELTKIVCRIIDKK